MSDDVIISIVDLETTGLEVTDKVIEAAVVDLLVRPDNSAMIYDIREGLFNPGHPIPAESMAVHHIRDNMVAQCPSFACAWQSVLQPPPSADRPPTIAFAAHNLDHERKFIPDAMTGVPWICTLKTAYRVFPDAPGHKNQVLRYHLGLLFDEQAVGLPHRAPHDATVSALILKEMLARGTDISDLLQWTADYTRYPRIPLGKHRRQQWSEPPDDYLEWVLRSDLETDIKMNADLELRRRRREFYVVFACRSAATATSEHWLRQWWQDSADHRAEHGIEPGDADYQRIVDACTARRDAFRNEGNSTKSAA